MQEGESNCFKDLQEGMCVLSSSLADTRHQHHDFHFLVHGQAHNTHTEARAFLKMISVGVLIDVSHYYNKQML